MTLFVWVRDTQPWSPPRLTPQIIYDQALADYLVKEKRLHIVARYELSEDDPLTLKELILKYPPPKLE